MQCFIAHLPRWLRSDLLTSSLLLSDSKLPSQRFLGLLGIHAFVNFASAGDIIQSCQDLPPSIRQGQYVSVIKNDTGRAPFSRVHCVINHPPMWIPWRFHKHLRLQEGSGLESISECNFVRRKTYVPSFGRWKPTLPTMKPWWYLGYAEMKSFSTGFPGPR